MSWRPNDWENPYRPIESGARDIFEDGADAMLEALRKMPYCTHPIMLPNGNYYLIPDEEEDVRLTIGKSIGRMIRRERDG